jgi:hypothetical protein
MPQSNFMQTRAIWILLAAGAALIAATGFLFVNSQLARLRVENSLLQQQLQLFDLQTRSQQTQLEAEQIITQAQLRNTTSLADLRVYFLQPPTEALSDASGCVVWMPGQNQGLFFAENLPPLAEEHKYRLQATSLTTGESKDCGSFSVRDATTEYPFAFVTPAGLAADHHPWRFSVLIEAGGDDSSPPQMVLFTN